MTQKEFTKQCAAAAEPFVERLKAVLPGTDLKLEPQVLKIKTLGMPVGRWVGVHYAVDDKNGIHASVALPMECHFTTMDPKGRYAWTRAAMTCGAALLAEETAGKIRGILADYAAVWQRLLAAHRAEETTPNN